MEVNTQAPGDTRTSEKKNSNNSRIIIIVLLIVIILLLIGVGAAVLFALRQPAPAQSVNVSQGTPQIGYANQGVTVVDDPQALQEAVDAMFEQAADSHMELEYQSNATSKDGKVFSCYLANAAANTYDMYIDIYADVDLTDQIFLSGLIRPGEAFESIELTRQLEPGTHTVYCAFTQVKEDLATIHGQVVIALYFTVL